MPREPTMTKKLIKGIRHFSRVPFHAQAQLRLHDRTLDVQLIDIALKGALVEISAEQGLVPQEKCCLTLSLAGGGDPIVMDGVIVHLEGKHVGIQCLNIDVTSLTQLRRLVELNTGDGDLMNRELSNLFLRG